MHHAISRPAHSGVRHRRRRAYRRRGGRQSGLDSPDGYTAIGDTVNVASRLEGETKYLNCVIAASAEAVHAAGVKVETGIHDTIRVKGRVEPVEVYEILDIGV